MPHSMHLHTAIYPNLKSIFELFKIYMDNLYSFIFALRDNGCLRLYGDSRVSREQPCINAYEILLRHAWLLFYSRHNKFAETHSHINLSYHITDRLLTAGNQHVSTHLGQPNIRFVYSNRCSQSL